MIGVCLFVWVMGWNLLPYWFPNVIVSCFGFGDCGQDCLFTSMRFSFGFSLGVGDENIFNTPTPNEKPNETLVNNCATANRSWHFEGGQTYEEDQSPVASTVATMTTPWTTWTPTPTPLHPHHQPPSPEVERRSSLTKQMLTTSAQLCWSTPIQHKHCHTMNKHPIMASKKPHRPTEGLWRGERKRSERKKVE